MLLDFIKMKLAEYSGPHRSGTPRGQLTGISRKRFQASLWALVDKPDKEISLIVKLSVGALYKLKTEQRYKDAVAAHCKQFAIFFIAAVMGELDREQKVHDEFLNVGSKTATAITEIETSGWERLTAEGVFFSMRLIATIKVEVTELIPTNFKSLLLRAKVFNILNDGMRFRRFTRVSARNTSRSVRLEAERLSQEGQLELTNAALKLCQGKWSPRKRRELEWMLMQIKQSMQRPK